MLTKSQLCSVATAVPQYTFRQSVIAERARDVLGLRMPDYERLAPVFVNAGIETRRAVQPMQWYEQNHSMEARTDVYLETATSLHLEVSQRAIERAGLRPSDIDTVVTVSSTGIATPSLEARVLDQLGLRNDVSRVPVFGLGCAGGVTGLSVAARLAEASPGSKVLVVAVELCTLAIRQKLTKANLVALALFADGAAAAVVGTGTKGIADIVGHGEYTWPDTLDVMGWDVDAEGLDVIFDRSIPDFATQNLAVGVDQILRRADTERNNIDRFICHPGGRKVIEAIEDALELEPCSLREERETLRHYGNMSAPTALFVLEKVIAAGLSPTSMLLALGPGFTLSGALLRVVEA